MDFDPRDLIDSNLALLTEARALDEPTPAVLMTIATWGRGADPELLLALQPYRHGLGYNGSIVARVPVDVASSWLPDEAKDKVESAAGEQKMLVYSAVFKDWATELL